MKTNVNGKQADNCKNETLGRKTYNEGYNLKDEVKKLLDKNGIKYHSIVLKIEDPYEKRRFKPEFVGQCVWIYQTEKRLLSGTRSGVLVKQTDLIGAPAGWLEEFLKTSLD